MPMVRIVDPFWNESKNGCIASWNKTQRYSGSRSGPQTQAAKC